MPKYPPGIALAAHRLTQLHSLACDGQVKLVLDAQAGVRSVETVYMVEREGPIPDQLLAIMAGLPPHQVAHVAVPVKQGVPGHLIEVTILQRLPLAG